VSPRDEYHEEQMEEAAWAVEPDFGASTREVYVGYGSWERARTVIQLCRRAGAGPAGQRQPTEARGGRRPG
jgi:hypothetical protein